MKADLRFMDVWALADCAARLLAQERPKASASETSRFCSRQLREPAVHALRVLWHTGHEDTRRTVRARVHAWLGTGRGRKAGP